MHLKPPARGKVWNSPPPNQSFLMPRTHGRVSAQSLADWKFHGFD